MTPALIFQKVRLAREASPFTTSLPTGCSVLVLGRDGDGIEGFWNLLGGESPAQGKVFRSAAVHSLTRSHVGRASVQGYLDSLGGPTLDALAIARLDDLRRKPAASLEPARWAQLEFAAALCSPAPIVALSAMVDNLDPWGEATLRDAQRDWGRTTIRFSRNPEQCAHADLVLILGRQTVLFADTPDHLRRSCLPVTYEVITGDPSACLAICAPYRLEITETETGFIFTSPEGQEVAAKLLTHGYGQVHTVMERLPSWQDALFEVCRTTVTGVTQPVPSATSPSHR